jgi:hypothetical protein
MKERQQPVSLRELPRSTMTKMSWFSDDMVMVEI